MSNPNPDTSGLQPFNKMDTNKRQQIQSAGGIARAEKARKVKSIREIIMGLRADAKIDPIEQVISNLYDRISNPLISINEQIRAISALHKICGEDKPENN